MRGKPSEVVRMIERHGFPHGLPGNMNTRTGSPFAHFKWHGDQRPIAATILARFDAIEDQLLREYLTGLQRDELDKAVQFLRIFVAGGLPEISTEHATTVHGMLLECQDESTPATVDDLPYIKDPQLKVDIARDLASLPRLLADEQWKAATVIAGSVIEAILLAKVEEQHASAVALAIRKNWTKTGTRRGKKGAGVPLDPEEWGLEKLVQASRPSALNILSDGEANACAVAQFYRNAIHPSVARVRAATDGTAYSAMGAMRTLVAKWKP